MGKKSTKEEKLAKRIKKKEIRAKKRFSYTKLDLWFSLLFRIALLAATGLNIWQKNWANAVCSFLVFITTFAPYFIAKKSKFYLPPLFDFIILLFLFLSFFLGELNDYYYRFWWWDIMLHSSSGILLGFIGFLLIYVTNGEKDIHFYLSPLFMAVIAFMFAVTLGVFWEIFEFTMDQLAGTNMQKYMLEDGTMLVGTDALKDSMKDLIVDSSGALVISIIGYFFARRKDNSNFKHLLSMFIDNNPSIFNKKNETLPFKKQLTVKDKKTTKH